MSGEHEIEAEPLSPIPRPDGTPCRPRKLSAHAVTGDGDILTGVVVFGTHDPGRAQPLADDYAAWQLGSGHVAADPVPVWWRDGFDCGGRSWVTDEARGRPGTWFREIIERTGNHA